MNDNALDLDAIVHEMLVQHIYHEDGAVCPGCFNEAMATLNIETTWLLSQIERESDRRDAIARFIRGIRTALHGLRADGLLTKHEVH